MQGYTATDRPSLAVLVAIETLVSDRELLAGFSDRSGSLPERIVRLIEHGRRATTTEESE